MGQGSIGERLRQLRHDRGWSQYRLIYALRKVATAEGLHPPSEASLKAMVSRWENAHRVPDEYNKRLLCAALQAPPTALDH